MADDEVTSADGPDDASAEEVPDPGATGAAPDPAPVGGHVEEPGLEPVLPEPGTRVWLVILAVVAVVVQFIGLYTPGSAVPSVPIVGIDKAVHAILFGVPVWLIGRLTGKYWQVALIFGLHAVASEIIQARYIPNRSGDPFDLLADAVGIAAALWLLTTPVRDNRASE